MFLCLSVSASHMSPSFPSAWRHHPHRCHPYAHLLVGTTLTDVTSCSCACRYQHHRCHGHVHLLVGTTPTDVTIMFNYLSVPPSHISPLSPTACRSHLYKCHPNVRCNFDIKHNGGHQADLLVLRRLQGILNDVQF